MFFKLSKELKAKLQEKEQEGERVKAFSANVSHKTKYFNSILFSNVESAKENLQKHASENSRLKCWYSVTEGMLNSDGKTFVSEGLNYAARGEKKGKEIIWS